MATRAHNTPGGNSLPLSLIDLDTHPDGDLMCLCSRAGALQDRADLEGVNINHWPLPPYAITLTGLLAEIAEIAVIEPQTIEAVRLKAMTLMGDEDSELNRSFGRYHPVAVIRDFLRLGVPA